MSLRVATYNVWNGARGREDLVLEVLRALSADVVVLQEVFDEAFVSRLARALDMQSVVARGNSRYYLAMLSRWPIAHSQSHHPSPPIQQTVLEATIDHPAGPLRVFGVHPISRPFVLLEWWRLWEVKVALRLVAQHKTAPCLLVGDFNACSPGDRPRIERLGILNRLMILVQGQRVYRFAIRAVLRSGMTDCFRMLHPESDGFTYGPPDPIGRIDYIFATPSLASSLTACFVARTPATVDHASDHYPVVADFAL
jgi:exonuclease III